MSRDLTQNRVVQGFPWWGTKDNPSAQIQSEAASNHPVIFVKLSFDDADVNFHSDHGTITWGGEDYTGVGRIGEITGIEENCELSRTPISMTLGGLPNDLLAIFLAEQYQGRKATVYLGYLDMTTYRLVDDPIVIYRGLMDSPTVKRGETTSITLTVESRFAQWDRPLIRRYNNEDQRARYSGDTGLQAVEQSTEKQIVWGAASP